MNLDDLIEELGGAEGIAGASQLLKEFLDSLPEDKKQEFIEDVELLYGECKDLWAKK